MTQRVLSLAHLTALACPPPQLVELAAASGCAMCGLRLLPASPGGVHYPLMHDAAQRRETQVRLRDSGVGVFDVEIVRIGERFDARAYEPFFEVSRELGARAVLVAGDDTDEGRLAAGFAALCDVAAPYGLTCDLEFMPWTAVRDAAAAARVVGAAGRPNGGVLVDAIHFARSGSTLDQVRTLPPARLHYTQVCDATVPGPTTAEALMHDARCARLPPGEGGIDLPGLLRALPSTLPVSIEIPNDARVAALGHRGWVDTVVGATRRLVGRLGRPDE